MACSKPFDIDEIIRENISTMRENALQEFDNKKEVFQQRLKDDLKSDKIYKIGKIKKKDIGFADYCDEEYLINCESSNVNGELDDVDEFLDDVGDWKDAAVSAWNAFEKWQAKSGDVLEEAYELHYNACVPYKNKTSTVHPGRQGDFIRNYINMYFNC